MSGEEIIEKSALGVEELADHTRSLRGAATSRRVVASQGHVVKSLS